MECTNLEMMNELNEVWKVYMHDTEVPPLHPPAHVARSTHGSGNPRTEGPLSDPVAFPFQESARLLAQPERKTTCQWSLPSALKHPWIDNYEMKPELGDMQIQKSSVVDMAGQLGPHANHHFRRKTLTAGTLALHLWEDAGGGLQLALSCTI